jgi:hypothetical protein
MFMINQYEGVCLHITILRCRIITAPCALSGRIEEDVVAIGVAAADLFGPERVGTSISNVHFRSPKRWDSFA